MATSEAGGQVRGLLRISSHFPLSSDRYLPKATTAKEADEEYLAAFQSHERLKKFLLVKKTNDFKQHLQITYQ